MVGKKKVDLQTVAMVIPLAFSSGALSISSKATALALPSSAKTWKGNSTLLQHRTEGSIYYTYHYVRITSITMIKP